MSTKARFTTTTILNRTILNRTKGGLCFAPLVAILEHPQQEVRKHRQARVHCQFRLRSACAIEQCICALRSLAAMAQSLTHQSSNLPTQMLVTRTSNDPAVQSFNKYTVYDIQNYFGPQLTNQASSSQVQYQIGEIARDRSVPVRKPRRA